MADQNLLSESRLINLKVQDNFADNWKELMNNYGADSVPFLFILDFELKKPLVYKLSELPEGILYKINEVRNFEVSPGKNQKRIVFDKFPVSYDDYQVAFNDVLKEINYGNSFLLNLTFPTSVISNMSLEEIFYRSVAKYKLYYKGNFIVFSPEIFVKIKEGHIFSYPMKGTIDASIPNAALQIINDPKETAEHYTIVDLIRNDLSIVAKNVHVPRFRYLDLIHTQHKSLWQVSSEIKGTLPADYKSRLGDIISTLLPAGSISGAPKPKTLEIIRRVERIERGYYTGVFGIFDGNDLDSGVMIRYIENHDKQLIYRSGCGITAQSDCKSEYNEMIDKVYVPTDRKYKNIQRESLQHSATQFKV
ncbi:MAG: aminodeoxychorismate synthase component I [Saprospiraceae bacterium]|nr:aminodeoxychorismate synthase component I [Saprospiraceae bacterium]